MSEASGSVASKTMVSDSTSSFTVIDFAVATGGSLESETEIETVAAVLVADWSSFAVKVKESLPV